MTTESIKKYGAFTVAYNGFRVSEITKSKIYNFTITHHAYIGECVCDCYGSDPKVTGKTWMLDALRKEMGVRKSHEAIARLLDEMVSGKVRRDVAEVPRLISGS